MKKPSHAREIERTPEEEKRYRKTVAQYMYEQAAVRTAAENFARLCAHPLSRANLNLIRVKLEPEFWESILREVHSMPHSVDLAPDFLENTWKKIYSLRHPPTIVETRWEDNYIKIDSCYHRSPDCPHDFHEIISWEFVKRGALIQTILFCQHGPILRVTVMIEDSTDDMIPVLPDWFFKPARWTLPR